MQILESKITWYTRVWSLIDGCAFVTKQRCRKATQDDGAWSHFGSIFKIPTFSSFLGSQPLYEYTSWKWKWQQWNCTRTGTAEMVMVTWKWNNSGICSTTKNFRNPTFYHKHSYLLFFVFSGIIRPLRAKKRRKRRKNCTSTRHRGENVSLFQHTSEFRSLPQIA